MGILLFVLVFVPVSFSPDFLSKISPQPFKIETSNLVYWFKTTGNNMGLKMDIFLFVVPCIFLSLYIFHLRYQPHALEALKRGIVRFSDSSSSIMVCAPVREIIHSLKLVDYLLVKADKPWYNYYMYLLTNLKF